MATIRLIFTEPDILPTNYVVAYREVGQQDYQFGTYLGPPPILIEGLPDGRTWEGTIKSRCGEHDATFSQEVNWGPIQSTPDATVVVTTSWGGFQITNITGINGFALSGSLSSGDVANGTHGAFTGSISLTATGSSQGSVNFNCTLFINDVATQCIPVSAAGTFTFNSRAYAASDVIRIACGIGTCSI